MYFKPIGLFMKTLFLIILFQLSVFAGDQYGTLIFEDKFERSEPQETKDEPGNGWLTNSNRRAKGNKQTDLRDGYIYVFRHKEADHSASLNREIEPLQNGTIGVKLKFATAKDVIYINIADTQEKSVHAGHLLHITVRPDKVMLVDLKTGQMDLKIRPAYRSKTLTQEQKKLMDSKQKTFKNKLALNKWHQVYATIKGDKISVVINGKPVASFNSPGFSHPTKRNLRFLVGKGVSIDDVQIWKAN